MARSYIVRWMREDGKYHTGALRDSKGRWVNESSRWGSLADAEAYRDSTAEIRPGFVFEIVESGKLPEIFRHCGEHAQAIGGKCNGCGKVLTAKDAS